ncbi:MAG: hypothetical protein HY675_05855 [Chloroflexi bacterium]|nr:hypothetical protein [Chloroflexota bacterium]
MFEDTYWHRDLETMPREQLTVLKEKRLRRMVWYVWQNSAFYRRKFEAAGVHPEDIRTLDDLRKIPVTTKPEIRGNQAKCLEEGKLPYADILCVDHKEVVTMVQTSGTTGKAFIKPWTDYDGCVQSMIFGILGTRGLWSAGLRGNDLLMFCWSIGGSKVGGSSHFLSMAGYPKFFPFTVITGHVGRSRQQLETMRDLGVTAFYGTASYVTYLGELAREIGMDPPRDFKLRKIFVHGEAGPTAVPALRTRIQEVWGCDCYDIWGQIETGPRGHECVHKAGMHISDDFHVFEVLDPDTHEPVGPGEIGDLTVTELDCQAAPLLRCPTHDLVKLDYDVCECGRTAARIVKIMGRADEMVKVRSLRFFPSDVHNVVEKIPGSSGKYLIILDKDASNRDTFLVRVEHAEGITDLEAFRQLVLKEVKTALGLTPEVEVVPQGTLERSFLKTATILDLRNPETREKYKERVELFRPF